MFSECYILHWGGKKGKEKKISFSPIFLSFFHLLSKGKTIWKANLGSLWWFNLTTNWFLSSFFQIVVGHQWMLRQLLACLIPLIKGHCGSKTETNGFFILHLSALQSNGTGSPLRVFLFRCIVSSFNKVKRGGGRGWRKKESNPIFLVPVSYVAWSDFFFFPELELGKAFEIQPVFMKVIFLWDFAYNENNPGCIFFLIIEIRPISCASSCLIWLKSSCLLISILSSPCVPFAFSCPVLTNPKMERNNIKLLGWFRQVIVCVCRMPFIWGTQRAWGTVSQRAQLQHKGHGTAIVM